MRSINQVFILGNLGAPPELHVSAAGVEVARMSVATHRPVRDGEGWAEQTDWHRVVVFERQARAAAEHLGKGDPVGVVGRLHYRVWTDEHGARRTSVELVGNSVSFPGRRTGAGAGQRASSEALAVASVEAPAAAKSAAAKSAPAA